MLPQRRGRPRERRRRGRRAASPRRVVPPAAPMDVSLQRRNSHRHDVRLGSSRPGAESGRRPPRPPPRAGGEVATPASERPRAARTREASCPSVVGESGEHSSGGPCLAQAARADPPEWLEPPPAPARQHVAPQRGSRRPRVPRRRRLARPSVRQPAPRRRQSVRAGARSAPVRSRQPPAPARPVVPRSAAASGRAAGPAPAAPLRPGRAGSRAGPRSRSGRSRRGRRDGRAAGW